jgi:hypothetical protein
MTENMDLTPSRQTLQFFWARYQRKWSHSMI